MTALLIVEAGDRVLAVPSAEVREIVPMGAVTRLPGAPSHIRGLLNVRGVLLTVIDLGERLGEGAADRRTGDLSVVVVTDSQRSLGLIVNDVHEVTESEVVATSAASGPEASGVVAGLGHFGEAIVLVVDVRGLVQETLA